VFKVYINLDGGVAYNLCVCNDLLALWSVMETLLGDGTRGVDAIGVVRVSEHGADVVFRPPIS